MAPFLHPSNFGSSSAAAASTRTGQTVRAATRGNGAATNLAATALLGQPASPFRSSNSGLSVPTLHATDLPDDDSGKNDTAILEHPLAALLEEDTLQEAFVPGSSPPIVPPQQNPPPAIHDGMVLLLLPPTTTNPMVGTNTNERPSLKPSARKKHRSGESSYKTNRSHSRGDSESEDEKNTATALKQQKPPQAATAESMSSMNNDSSEKKQPHDFVLDPVTAYETVQALQHIRAHPELYADLGELPYAYTVEGCAAYAAATSSAKENENEQPSKKPSTKASEKKKRPAKSGSGTSSNI